MSDDSQFYIDLLRAYLDSANDAIFVLCDEMKFLVCNRRMEEWLGKAEKELTAHGARVPITEWLGTEEARDLFMRGFIQALQGKPSRFECYMEPALGRGRWVEVQLNRVEIEAGDMVMAVARDISERRQAEAELEKYRHHLEALVADRTAALEAANAELEAFSYSVSHDLRAPLRAIDGFSRALLEEEEDRLGETGKDYLRRVCTAATRMSSLIDDLLMLSRISSGELQRQTVDLSALVEAVASRMRESDPGRQAQISIQPGMQVSADRRLLQIVLENLLDNAWKYTGQNETTRIHIGSTGEQGQTVYFVRDNGVGFDMKYADKLFNVFERLHGAEFSGSGIGLATVKRIIVRHGGKVWGEGRPGEGAGFYFTLPG